MDEWAKRLISTLAMGAGLALAGPVAAQVALKGVSLAGADFGEDNLPGEFGTHYTYPTPAEVDYFLSRGMNLFRLPFRWERLQPVPGAGLDRDELSRLRAIVTYATGKGAHVVLDPHNYARYFGKVVGSPDLPTLALADFWTLLAREFGSDRRVIFGLMNEPFDMATAQWLEQAKMAIAAIRETGAQNLVLVPGNAWSGAHSWTWEDYGGANAVVMAGVRDPGNNFAHEVHQYLDEDSSGASAQCVSATIGSDRLRGFTEWLEQHGAQGFLGEFAGGANERCAAALGDMLGFIERHPDQWIGWAWWAAGPWWGDYAFSLEPEAGRDRPQMAVLDVFLKK